MNRYWIKGATESHYREVCVREYVKVERACGFHNTMGHSQRPATAAFTGADGTEGTTFEPVGRVAVVGFDPGHQYYNVYGEPISIEEWVRLRADPKQTVLAEFELDGRTLRTVWLGMVVPDIYDARLFGTAIISEEGTDQIEVYDNEVDALRGHHRHVIAMKSGEHCARCADHLAHID